MLPEPGSALYSTLKGMAEQAEEAEGSRSGAASPGPSAHASGNGSGSGSSSSSTLGRVWSRILVGTRLRVYVYASTAAPRQ